MKFYCNFEKKTNAWEQRKLGDVKDVRDGTHSSPSYYSQGYPLITSKNLSENELNFDNVSYISEKDYIEINKRSRVDIGDILLGLIGTIGNPVLVRQDGFAIKNVGLIKNSGSVQNKFLLQLLKNPLFMQYIQQKNTGNTQKFLGLAVLRNYSFFCPTIEEQQKIGDFFTALDRYITIHQHK
ncbi:restriction endonuclease subunit S [Pelistega ratti]|uniref:restriction endonuclease subunit S n=1 Tax=Pelistega ratti TaxID=2652177 RepID=UPI0019166B9A|nr:restriction endonuclease subunit S [Pelistega ratti]